MYIKVRVYRILGRCTIIVYNCKIFAKNDCNNFATHIFSLLVYIHYTVIWLSLRKHGSTSAVSEAPQLELYHNSQAVGFSQSAE